MPFASVRSGKVPRSGRPGIDEIAYAWFDATRDDAPGILKDYMASRLFSRGGIEMPSEGSILMVGNTDHGTKEAQEEEEGQELLADDVVPGAGTHCRWTKSTGRRGNATYFSRFRWPSTIRRSLTVSMASA